jgi:ActR/RegA family two-component response regulator
MISGRLIIIDDDRATRDGLQYAFIRRGWEVVAATTEEEGLAVLSDFHPDWVIASWDQLSGNGAAFVREVRKKAHGVRLSILTEPGSRSALFTANLKPELMLAKPIQADDVYSACTGA